MRLFVSNSKLYANYVENVWTFSNAITERNLLSLVWHEWFAWQTTRNIWTVSSPFRDEKRLVYNNVRQRRSRMNGPEALYLKTVWRNFKELFFFDWMWISFISRTNRIFQRRRKDRQKRYIVSSRSGPRISLAFRQKLHVPDVACYKGNALSASGNLGVSLVPLFENFRFKRSSKKSLLSPFPRRMIWFLLCKWPFGQVGRICLNVKVG